MSEKLVNLGPLEQLLSDSQITAIVVDEDGIRYQKDGTFYTSELDFSGSEERLEIIQTIVGAGDASLSEDNPTVNCVLSDGTRVEARLVPLLLRLHKA